MYIDLLRTKIPPQNAYVSITKSLLTNPSNTIDLVKLPTPSHPRGEYSQWQSNTVAQQEGICRAPAPEQPILLIYMMAWQEICRVYGQTAEQTKISTTQSSQLTTIVFLT